MITAKNLKRIARTGVSALLLPVAIGLTGCNAFGEKDTVVTFASLPAAAQKTINDNRAGGKIGKVTSETKKGSLIYEAEVVLADGSELELKVAGEGKLLKSKKEKGDHDDNDDDKKCTAKTAGGATMESGVAFAAIPPAVQKTILAHTGGAKVEKVVHEASEKKYEASFTGADGAKSAVEVSEDGTFLVTEVNIAFESAPEAVRKAAVEHFKGFRITGAIHETDANGKVNYEVQATLADGTVTDIDIAPDGTIAK